jgi:hypothetical protein
MKTSAFLATLAVILICRAALAQNRPPNSQGVIERGPHGPPASVAPRNLTSQYADSAYYQTPRAIHAYTPNVSPSCQISRRMQHAQSFYELRSMHEQYQASHRTARPSTEQLTVQAKRYAPDQLDLTSIKEKLRKQVALKWPKVLQQDQFARDRALIEDALLLDDDLELANYLVACADRLANEAANIRPDRYAEAKKFLAGLRYGL